MATLISSQEYRNEDIISEKIENRDFVVLVSPVFEVEGEEFQVVLDGHHSLSAAIKAGEAPDFEIADESDHDAVALIWHDIDLFLEHVHMGDDYHNAITGQYVF